MLGEDLDHDEFNREKKKNEMVVAMHKKNKEDGTFETVPEIFSRLPVPRIEKNGYKFLFDNMKDNIDLLLREKDALENMKQTERKKIDAIEVKIGKGVEIPEQNIIKEVLPSKKTLFKSLIYLRDKKQIGTRDYFGDVFPFLEDEKYIDFNQISQEIPNLKLFLENQPALHQFSFEFLNQNQVVFENREFPATFQLNKRAEALAKLYLLELYREQKRKIASMNRMDEGDLQKKRQINKIKQDMEKQKLKEGQLIEDMDLMKQVIRILELIEKKMNAWAYDQFRNRNGDRATEIKKSLEKLKNTVNTEPMPKTKLKLLIAYKHKKGW